MHRAESILDAVATALSGLATTGARVERDRNYPPDLCPALSVDQGSEDPIQGREVFNFMDCALNFGVTIQVKTDTPNTQLNQIKAEVYEALMANRNLSLSYVFDTQWLGDSEPDSSADAETKTSKCTMRFAVAYRHSITSKES